VEKISDILLAIDEAEHPQEVALFPGWRLHPLKGELRGFWSVTVSGNWRVVFRFEKGEAFDVDLVDYH
jgi:toxin HigB-1